jgi:hypothetical protein
LNPGYECHRCSAICSTWTRSFIGAIPPFPKRKTWL